MSRARSRSTPRQPAPVVTVRNAVRHALRAVPASGPVLVACSGGADSLALAAAAMFVGSRLGRGVGLVTVDHGLQDGSAERADELARWARGQGFVPAESVAVDVTGLPGGPEAAARGARYTALLAAAHRYGSPAVLLGHTRDDQAETVLLALARGAGPRGMAGMPPAADVDGVALLRPLLDVSRADTGAACAALGLDAWQDPHNTDPAYARARVRAVALPSLVAALGPAVVDNLARSATMVAQDTAVLDELAATGLTVADDGDGLSVQVLAGMPAAVRTRVLHRWARSLGVSPAALSQRHVAALDALVVAWRGQGPTSLPGGIRVSRSAGSLVRVPSGESAGPARSSG